MGFRKLFFVNVLFTALIAQAAAVTPALAWRDDDRSYHRGGGHGGHRGWGHHDDHWRHYRGHDRGHHRSSNFQIILNQSYGSSSGWSPYYGHRPEFRTYRRHQPEVYYGRNDSNLLGTLFGGAVGGIAGSQIGDGSGRTAAIIGGTVIGALVGGNIGRSPYDHAHAANVFEVTPSNQTVAWQNPDDGYAYQVTPIRTYQANSGQYCREYQAVATVGGRAQSTYGTACRTPDGDWQIMN
ncbi:MAG: RT0821/Lpp0805 family surface protein [Pseudomonadota bacterium]